MAADATSRTLRAVLGEGMRRARLDAGLRQEDVARMAVELGLRWSASRITTLERGDKAISAEELFALVALVDRLSGRRRGLSGLIADDAGSVILTPGYVIEATDLTAALCPPAPAAAARLLPDGPFVGWSDSAGATFARPDVADYRAAAKLRRPVAEILHDSQLLWGRSLTDERDRIVNESREPDDSSARLKALRGRVTRKLVADLDKFMQERPPIQEM